MAISVQILDDVRSAEHLGVGETIENHIELEEVVRVRV